jgi:hypothetical protein
MGPIPSISAGGGGPSWASAANGPSSIGFDSSNWTVGTGKAKADGGALPKISTTTLLIIGAVALVGLKIWAKR